MICQRLFNSTRRLARELAWQLEHQQQRIVFAESCTAGLASAILAQIPGISNWLCGSAVVYQEATKQQWLQIDPMLIKQHTAVSAEVTFKLAEAVLKQTPHADISVAITGHLDRDATDTGSVAYICIRHRRDGQIQSTNPVLHPLNGRTRINRQWQAAELVLKAAVDDLHFPPTRNPQRLDWSGICGAPTNIQWKHWF